MLLDSNSAKKNLGILLHPSSLPGGSYCGTFGDSIKNWISSLAKYKINTWQFLPLSPTDSMGSPYSSPSSFALNPWFLDINELIKNKYILKSNFSEEIMPIEEDLDSFEFSIADKLSKNIGKLLLESWDYQSLDIKYEFSNWCEKNRWVEDHSIFMVLKEKFDMSAWWNWPKEFRDKNLEAIEALGESNSEDILTKKLIQWHLNRQWLKIKNFAQIKGIKLVGDLPFYVSKDSVDVWSNKSLFSISDQGDLFFQSGVPPDYFSATGQLWGTPVYSWSNHISSSFDWWKKRFKRQFELVDILRLDHFRALAEYWSIEGSAKNAIEGKWIASPGEELLDSLKDFLNVNQLPIIAEDLGVITDDVISLRKKYGLPGMKILQFAFDGNADNPYLPQNINGNNWVVYTGTHDNSTILSWWNNLETSIKENIKKKYHFSDQPSWDLIRIGMQTKANLFIAPFQDILGLDDSSRTNTPGTIENNWKWKINKPLEELEPFFKKYGAYGKIYSRVN